MQEPHCHRYPAQADPDPVPAYFPLLQAPPAAALQLPEPEVHPEDFFTFTVIFFTFFPTDTVLAAVGKETPVIPNAAARIQAIIFRFIFHPPFPISFIILSFSSKSKIYPGFFTKKGCCAAGKPAGTQPLKLLI